MNWPVLLALLLLLAQSAGGCTPVGVVRSPLLQVLAVVVVSMPVFWPKR